jgi:hypothetical protein
MDSICQNKKLHIFLTQLMASYPFSRFEIYDCYSEMILQSPMVNFEGEELEWRFSFPQGELYFESSPFHHV